MFKYSYLQNTIANIYNLSKQVVSDIEFFQDILEHRILLLKCSHKQNWILGATFNIYSNAEYSVIERNVEYLLFKL